MFIMTLCDTVEILYQIFEPTKITKGMFDPVKIGYITGSLNQGVNMIGYMIDD